VRRTVKRLSNELVLLSRRFVIGKRLDSPAPKRGRRTYARVQIGDDSRGNLTELKSAADALRTAREQCRKYIDEDAPRQKKELLQAAQEKSSAYDDALVALDDAKIALADAVSQESETVTAAQKKVTESETALTRAHRRRGGLVSIAHFHAL
jgi:hypothetical protein